MTLVTVLGVWLLAGEVFARDRLAQLVAAGTAALAPMIQFVSASLNPDAMLYAAWSIALWLGVRLLKRGLSVGGAAAFSAPSAPPAWSRPRATRWSRPRCSVVAGAVRRAASETLWRVPLAAGAAAVVVTLGTWLVVAHLSRRAAAGQVNRSPRARSGFNLREFGSYVWQFYLPRLPFQTPFPLPGNGLPLYDVWLKQAWGSYGWLEVNLPGFLYAALTAVTVGVVALALAGSGARAARSISRWSRSWSSSASRWSPACTGRSTATSPATSGRSTAAAISCRWWASPAWPPPARCGPARGDPPDAAATALARCSRSTSSRSD